MARRIPIVLAFIPGMIALAGAGCWHDPDVAIKAMPRHEALLREQPMRPLPMAGADFRIRVTAPDFRITGGQGAAHRQQRAFPAAPAGPDMEGRARESRPGRTDGFARLPAGMPGLP